MKIIIIGYSGLIGRTILESLSKKKSLQLVCVGRNNKFKPIRSSKIKYLKWDFKSFKKRNLYFLNKSDVLINCVGKMVINQKNLDKVNVIFVQKLLSYINTYRLRLRFIQLGSVSVYGASKYTLGSSNYISEKSLINTSDEYSRSKFKADSIIQNNIEKNHNKYFSYTILRISNVFGGKKKSNLFKYVNYTIKYKFWIRCSKKIVFNFINVKDVAQAVLLVVSKLQVSKNKIYILSDDCSQSSVYQNYQQLFNKKIRKINVPLSLVKFIFNYLPLPKKILNFLFIISTRISFSNKKIKRELIFKPRYSLTKILEF